MIRITPFVPAALALLLAGCGLSGTLSRAGLQWRPPERRAVLVQSDAPSADGLLGQKLAARGATLLIAGPSDDVESMYGACLGVSPDAYAWESRECAAPVGAQYRADYALFLSREARTATLTLIDLSTGGVAWMASVEDADWNNQAAAGRALDRLLEGAPF